MSIVHCVSNLFDGALKGKDIFLKDIKRKSPKNININQNHDEMSFMVNSTQFEEHKNQHSYLFC